MHPRRVSDPLVRDSPILRSADTVDTAVSALLATDLPALPVVDRAGRLVGIFGEREFFRTLFPGYLEELPSAGFVSRSLEAALDKRSDCRTDPVSAYMTTDHVDVAEDFSDAQVAETFMHHRVLALPVVDDGRVIGVITRSDFFRALADRFLSPG